jgi:spore coat protein U-like protein
MLKILAKIIILSLFSAAIYAGTVPGTLAVTATVAATCIVATLPVAFGILTSFTVNNDATGTINVTCTNTAPYTVALDIGSGSGATFAARKMTSGANTMNYTLYTATARTTIWGDGTNSTSTVPGTGNGAVQNLTVYGRVPIQTQPALGVYADTVNVTVSF